jgi:hypothetical protein
MRCQSDMFHGGSEGYGFLLFEQVGESFLCSLLGQV